MLSQLRAVWNNNARAKSVTRCLRGFFALYLAGLFYLESYEMISVGFELNSMDLRPRDTLKTAPYDPGHVSLPHMTFCVQKRVPHLETSRSVHPFLQGHYLVRICSIKERFNKIYNELTGEMVTSTSAYAPYIFSACNKKKRRLS